MNQRNGGNAEAASTDPVNAGDANFMSILQQGYDGFGQAVDPEKLPIVERIAIAEFLVETFETGAAYEDALAYLHQFVKPKPPVEEVVRG